MTTFYLLEARTGGTPVIPGPARYAFQSSDTKKRIGMVLRASPGRWAFLTCRDGVLFPEQLVEQGPGRLKGRTEAQILAWAESAYPVLRGYVGAHWDVQQVSFLCSEPYAAHFGPWLLQDFAEGRGLVVEYPFRDRDRGAQARWLNAQVHAAEMARAARKEGAEVVPSRSVVDLWLSGGEL
jgi:hypothetical protein